MTKNNNDLKQDKLKNNKGVVELLKNYKKIFITNNSNDIFNQALINH